MTRGLLALAALAVALALFFAPSALANSCTLSTSDNSVLFDSGGYYFDTNGAQTTPDRNAATGSLDDSGSNGPAGTPPGPVDNSDSYDEWGGLFIGGDDLTDLYTTTDDNSCTLVSDGHQLVYPVVNINGLDVQRTLFVSPTGLPGARLLELVHNPGTAPVTTSVQLGDIKAASNQDDLGSDNATVVDFSSSGDQTFDANDLWSVTTDHPTGTLYDNALAHIMDGAGGADRVDVATLTGTAVGDPSPQDNLMYRWNNVAIPPGGTAAFVSFEVQQADATKDAVMDSGLARQQALNYEALPFAQIYAGLSDDEIAAVRNWPKPQPTAVIAAVSGASNKTAVTLSDSGSQASSVPGICQGPAVVSWNFGDGGTGSGASVSHKFAAGTYNVTLTVTNDCGATATTSRSITVADKVAPTVSASIAKRIKFSKLAAGKLVLTLKSSENGTASIAGTVSKSVAKKATAAKISRTIIKKKARLGAAKRTKVHLKLSKKARKGLATLHRNFALTITVTTRDSAGNKRVTHKHVKATF